MSHYNNGIKNWRWLIMPMGTYQQIINKLKELQIPYQIVDHPAAETTEEADEYIKDYEGVRTKSMFLKDKKKHFHLVVLDDKKRFNFHEFQDITGAKRVSMARPNEIKEQLGLVAGIISPFGLMNNSDHNIQVYFDKDMLAEDPILTFHPNENTHTIFLKSTDLMKFIRDQGFEPQIIDL